MSLAKKDEAPAVAAAQGSPNETSSSADIVADASFCGKRFATLQALLAMRGHELRRLPNGTLLVQRWGLSRELGDLDEAEQFLAQIGGSL